ncbi:Variable outer membrane protein [Borrelia duttonii CR2A]|uniref:Variable outer membrane protein n=1 Tax=Borrelia duttonii CR2A TaxID=1432657 RepID=W6TEY9_9SPIR|nr:Variable outer membrane protein [Borrelia duttonii CR2A]
MKREVKEGEIKGKRGIERVKRMDKIGKRMRIKGIIVMMMGCNSGDRDLEKVFLSEMVKFRERIFRCICEFWGYDYRDIGNKGGHKEK